MDAVSQQQARYGGTRHDVARIKGASIAPSSSLPSLRDEERLLDLARTNLWR
jgi:hypothetical protein